MVKKLKPPPEEEDAGTHAWADGSTRFLGDQFLRIRGWHILERAGTSEPLWELLGAVATHSEALAMEGFCEQGDDLVPLVSIFEPEGG